MVLGFLVAAVHVFLRRPRRVVALYAPAAAAVATASFYTYDPYYAPSSRRYSDGGAVSPVWILGMVALSLAVGASTLRSPRIGSAATALFLPVLLVTWVLALDGH